MNSLLASVVLGLIVAAAAFLITRIIVSIGLRLFGLRVPVLFLQFGDKSDTKTRDSLQRLSEGVFVFVYGVLLWGLPFLVALTALDESGRYDPGGKGVTVDGLVGSVLICAVVGIAAGVKGWRKLATPG